MSGVSEPCGAVGKWRILPPKMRFDITALHRPKEALEDDEHPWWYMTAR